MSTEQTRESLETSKQRAIVFREWGYFALVVIVAGMFIWAMWAFKAAQNVSGAINSRATTTFDKLDAIAETIESKLNAIDTSKVGPLLQGGTDSLVALKSRIDDLGQTQAQLTGLVKDTRGEIKLLVGSLTGVADEARVQVKQNGDEAAKTIASLNRTLTDLDTRISKVLDDGSLILETANPKLMAALDNANAAIIDADGRIKAFEPIQTNLAGITADFNAMTTDSKNKLHELFFPAQKHGWARVGQVATYLLQPIFEGTRLYFQLTSLPVRLTQPIPIGKP